MSTFRIDFGTYQTFRQDWPEALRVARLLRQVWLDARIVNLDEVDGAEDAGVAANHGLTRAQWEEWEGTVPIAERREFTGVGVLYGESKVLDRLPERLDKAAALDLLEQWLDVHPKRSFLAYKTAGKLEVSLYVGDTLGTTKHSSGTQETLASAIRTVLGIARSNGDK